MSAYIVPHIESTPFVYAAFGKGWHPEEYDGDHRWRWMEEEGEIVLVNTGQVDVPVRVLLFLQSYRVPRQATVMFDRQSAGSLTILPKASGMALRLLIPPGEHRLVLRTSVDADPKVPDRSVSVAVFDARLLVMP
ncbi:hypothetical protein [Chloroflexus sp.]|uniref:hypothetical protein n=1 Tax=Chloroflexus sp. TaxID=1904827 RepID=UPI004049641D